MNCPKCDSHTGVMDTRLRGDIIRRRRLCESGHRFVTYESTIDPSMILRQRATRAKAEKRRWEAKTPAERQAIKHREHMRASARREAQETGEDVNAIYKRYGVE